MLLVMSVNPGFGGQSFMPEVLPKIEQARNWIESHGLEADIEVDGGISSENITFSQKCRSHRFRGRHFRFRCAGPSRSYPRPAADDRGRNLDTGMSERILVVDDDPDILAVRQDQPRARGL